MLETDSRVRVTTKMGDKGPLAVSVELLEAPGASTAD